MRAFYEDRSYRSTLPVSAFESRDMSYFAHWHEDVELVCVLGGELTVGVNNEVCTLYRGDIAVCSSGDIHYYDCKGAGSLHRMIIFRPELIGSAGGWPQGFSLGSPFLQGAGFETQYNRFNAVFDTVSVELEKPDMHSPMIVRSELLGLCAALARAMLAKPEDAPSFARRHLRLKGMQDVLAYLERNYTDEIRLEDAASIAGLSACHFSRLFASVAGAGFHTYLAELRLNRAEEMLKNSRQSITDIAYQCGFDSIRTFNRVFLKSRGFPPSGLRTATPPPGIRKRGTGS